MCRQEFIFAYYDALGVGSRGGWAREYAWNKLPDGWQRITYQDGVTAQPGDIAVWWDGSSDEHVAIVDSADSVAMNVIEANAFNHPEDTINWTPYSGEWEGKTIRYGVLNCFIRPDFGNGGREPVGYVDFISSDTPGYIRIAGWAFDYDNLSENVLLHVYEGAPACDGTCYKVTCNGISRPDVVSQYGDVGSNHGFDLQIPVAETGSQPVYVYAIDTGPHVGNPLIGQGTVTITEKPLPTITVEPAKICLIPREQTTVKVTVLNGQLSKFTYPYDYIEVILKRCEYKSEGGYAYYEFTVKANEDSIFIRDSRVEFLTKQTPGAEVKVSIVPGAPTNVSASTSGTAVTVNWTGYKGATRYRVMRSTDGKTFTTLGYTSSLSYTDNSVQSGKTYTYRITSYYNDLAGKTSIAKSITFVAAPAVSSVKNVKGGIKITWASVSGADTYSVYRKGPSDTK